MATQIWEWVRLVRHGNEVKLHEDIETKNLKLHEILRPRNEAKLHGIIRPGNEVIKATSVTETWE